MQDALLAFAESAKVFINYITAAANDACKEAKRQTMSQADVLSALDNLQFGELVPGVKESLEGQHIRGSHLWGLYNASMLTMLTCTWGSFAALKKDSRAKNAKKTSDQKKRKVQPEKGTRADSCYASANLANNNLQQCNEGNCALSILFVQVASRRSRSVSALLLRQTSCHSCHQRLLRCSMSQPCQTWRNH